MIVITNTTAAAAATTTTTTTTFTRSQTTCSASTCGFLVLPLVTIVTRALHAKSISTVRLPINCHMITRFVRACVYVCAWMHAYVGVGEWAGEEGRARKCGARQLRGRVEQNGAKGPALVIAAVVPVSASSPALRAAGCGLEVREYLGSAQDQDV